MKNKSQTTHISKTMNIIVFFFLVMSFGFVDLPSAQAQEETPALRHVPGRLIIKLKLLDSQDLTADSQEIPNLIGELSQLSDASVMTYHPLYQLLNKANANALNKTLSYYVLEFSPTDDIAHIAQRIMHHPRIEFAVPDYIVRLNLTPNDTLFSSQQWAFNDSATAKMHFPSAWAYTTGVTNVVIAVLDSGLDVSHPDISNKNTGNGYNFIGNNSDIRDDHWHGTNVAGLAAAASNNSRGVAGACWNCQIMPIKVCDTNEDCPTSAVTSGIYWATDHGADIINMSLGGATTGFGALLWQEAIDYAYDQGVVLVAAVGNSNQDLDAIYSVYPAQANHIIAVGATNNQDQRCDPNTCQWLSQFTGSAHGSKLDVMAPGSSTLTSTDIVGPRGLSLGDYSSNFGGTSGAAPIVSGLAGLMLSANPSLSPDQIETLLKQNADPLGSARPNNWYGWGRINAANSVRAVISVFDNATFVTDVTIPNGTVLNPGQTFTKTWRMMNSGITNWGNGYDLVYIGGNQLGAPSAVSVPLTSPGNNAEISVNMAAPSLGGNYTGYWRMRNSEGQFFGDTIWVNINVSGPFSSMSHCGSLNSNETWSGGNIVHTVTCDVTIAQGVTLTIAEGAIVKFNSEQRLIVNGKLTASGTTLNPVYFTSYRDDTIGGDTNGDGSSIGLRSDWENILFNDSSDDTSVIDHAIIRFAGDAPPYGGPYGGVHLLSASPTIQNTEFAENHFCAISANLGSFPRLTGNNIHNNAANGFCLLGGDILAPSATWDITDTSYFLRGDVTVPFGKSLTMNPGVVVKIDSEKRLIVNGKLTVPGTSTNPVYFTSYRDDTIGGDTNGNGSSFGARSDWEHILFNDSSNDTSLIDHAIVRFSGDAPPYGGPYGGVHLLSASPTIQNTEFAENHYCAISANMASFPILLNNNIHSNAANAFCLLGGDIPVSAVWNITDTSYLLRNDVTIPLGKNLTINPDVVVKFDSERSLIVNGKLTAAGTNTDKIYFTSYRDDTIGGDTNGNGSSFGARSDWERILFNDTSDDTSVIKHAVIRFSGDAPPYGGPYGGIHLLSASPTIQNTELAHNHYCAISANLGSFPVLNDNNIHDNAANGFCLLGGDLLVTPAVWNITNTSYFLRGDVTIPLGKNLTINQGVTVKLDPEKSLIVNGKLNVSGTSTAKVYFTSYRDDTIGGDTNGNGSSFGNLSDWEHILFNDSSEDTSVINHAVIRFGGDAPPYGGPYGGIHLLGASPTIQNTTIERSQFAGLSASSSSPILGCNNILNNSNYGIYNATPNIIIQAENQWWGSAAGPHHPTSNPGGTGNRVSDGVAFIPYSASTCGSPATNTDVYIGGIKQASYYVPPHGSVRASFAGLNSGPVKIVSKQSIVAAERLIYRINGVNTSFSELMGLPANQLDTTYWLPWYNNVELDTQLRIANVSNSQATITVTIGGAPQQSFNLAAGASTRVSYPGVNNGPVKIVSTQNIVAAERVIYKVDGINTSFTEMMALPQKQLDKIYYLPWYNNVDLDTQLRIANVSDSQASITVTIGGVPQPSFNLAAGASTRVSYAANNGPVKIVSTQNMVAAERVIYRVNGKNTSFSEMMALPENQLDTTYWLPWFNNVELDTQLRIANVSGSPATVTVTIGGTILPSFNLAAGQSTRVSYSVNNGPVKIVSTQNIVVAERVIYKVNGVNTSFAEMMGLPNIQIDMTYWLPWYNNKDLDTQLRFGVP